MQQADWFYSITKLAAEIGLKQNLNITITQFQPNLLTQSRVQKLRNLLPVRILRTYDITFTNMLNQTIPVEGIDEA
jgi:hypothetical protein